MLSLVLPLLLLKSPPDASPAKNEPFELTLKGTYLASQLTEAFKGTLIEIESDRRKDRHLIKGGQVQFGPGLGAKHVQFSVPKMKYSLGWLGEVTYRLRDVHLRTIEAMISDGQYLLEGRFDGKGPQIVGSHSALGGVVPGVYMQNIRVMIWLTPTIDSSGKLSYENLRTRFASRMNTQGLSFTLSGHHVDLVDSMTGYHRRISQLIADRLRETLDDPDNKVRLCSYLNSALEARASTMGAIVKGMRVDGTDLKVTLQAKPKL